MSTKFEKSLAKIQETLRNNLRDGVLQAALVLQMEAQKRSPVDTGALRASAFTRAHNESNPNVVEYRVGFTQFYGIYVHEMPGPFKVGQPKFLEGPARELASVLGKIIEKSVKEGKK